MPENVSLAVAVEVAGADDRPRGAYVSDAHGPRGPGAVHVHQPDRSIAAAVAPQNVVLAVAVEVALSDERPRGGHGAERARRRDRSAIHQPRRYVAAGVAPGNIALAVTVEIVGIDGC